MMVNRSYVSYMAQMAVDSIRNEFKLGRVQFLNNICGKSLKIHVFNITKHYKLVSLETGDKMLCSKHIYNSIL